jgi:pyrroloquinoline-quinone synthase
MTPDPKSADTIRTVSHAPPPPGGVSPSALAPEAFTAWLRSEGERGYHHRHAYHRRMHEGQLTREQLQRWVLNRYYYQTRIPIKDALILAKSDDPRFRRSWMKRIVDHDGAADGEGGLARWLKLAEAVGLSREVVASCAEVLPAVRFACDAYVALVRESPLLVAVASSLTEFFAPQLMSERIAAWEKHYPWVDLSKLDYFRARVTEARQDSEQALAFVLANARSYPEQQACVGALVRKTQILWQLLDALYVAYVEPGWGTAGPA